MTEDQTETPIEAQRRREAAERQRVAEVIRRDQIERGLEAARAALMRSDEDELAKRPNETWAQFKARVEQHSFRRRIGTGFLITPETEAHGDYQDATVIHIETDTATQTKRNVTQTQIETLYSRGGITQEQFEAAEQIIGAMQIIEKDVAMKFMSFDLKIDSASGGRSLLSERMAVVIAQITYSRWRDSLPTPKAMVLEMISVQRPIFRTARMYNVGYPRAKRLLVNSLDAWCRIRDHLWDCVSRDEVEALQAVIDGGVDHE